MWTECAKSKECAPHKHHYDECVERVTKQQEENDGKADEDCIEECKHLPIYYLPSLSSTLWGMLELTLIPTVFHLAHCATNCAAPKLFKLLK